MIIWRIVKGKYAASAFDGEGARQFGGRWNSPGIPMVYGFVSLSLAALEILVHMEVMDFGFSRVSIQVDVPSDISLPTIPLTQLPIDWRELPAPQALATLGDDWIRREDSLLLGVPSAIIPQESNILVNPHHPDFARLLIHSPEPFSLDPCLINREVIESRLFTLGGWTR